jgi:ubiquinone/menaquinone biosynthesis C-methylase UbiE
MGDDRISREREFHDDRFADDSERQQTVGRFYQIVGRMVAEYSSGVLENASGKRVLEYGCGTGSQAFSLAAKGVDVTAIDISSTAIALASQQAQRLGVGMHVTFAEMNAEELALADHSMDLICGSGILHHLDLERSCAEINRVLVPGGTAHFIEPLGHNLAINLFRRLTPRLRSEDEHPLMAADLDFLAGKFQKVTVDYYYLTALLASLIPRQRLPSIFDALLRALDAFDRLLFRLLPPLRKQAWFCRIVVTKQVPRQEL